MIKKIFALGLIGLTFSLGSCKKQDIEPDTKAIQEGNNHHDNEYIDFELLIEGKNEIEGGNDELRTYYSLNSNLPKFSFGDDNSKLKVHTVITKLIDSPSKEAGEVLFNADLEWTVTNSGRMLSYKGNGVKILRSKVSSTDKLTLAAFVLSKTNTAKPTAFRMTPLKEITTAAKSVDLDIPYVMTVGLERAGTEGRQLKIVTGGDPKFHPLGKLALCSVKNTGKGNVTFKGLKGTELHTEEGMEYHLDPHNANMQKNSLKTWNAITGNANATLSISNTTITPNQTKYFIFWRGAIFSEAERLASDLLKPTFAEDLTINHPRGKKYKYQNEAKLVKWEIEVSDQTESSDLSGVGVDFAE